MRRPHRYYVGSPKEEWAFFVHDVKKALFDLFCTVMLCFSVFCIFALIWWR